MRVLVTGSAGFIGFHTAKRLLERGDTVIGFDNFNEYYDATLKERRNALLEKHATYTMIRGSLTNEEDLRRAFDALGKGSGETRVCHLAAQAGVRHSIEHPQIFLEDNVLGFGNVIELVKQREINGLIYASTSAVYGDNPHVPFKEDHRTDNQMSLYGMTKKANELQASVYHNLFAVHCTGLRFFTVYGTWGRPDMALFLFTEAILKGKTLKIFGHGKMRRDFTYVEDIAAGVIASIDKNYPLEVMNLGGGKTEELMDFVKAIETACGKEGKKEFLPMQPGDVVQTVADIEKAKKLLGYDPKTRIEEGVPKFVEWYREYYGL